MQLVPNAERGTPLCKKMYHEQINVTKTARLSLSQVIKVGFIVSYVLDIVYIVRDIISVFYSLTMYML